MTQEIQVSERSQLSITHPWWPKPLSIREVVRCNLRECDRYVALYRTAGEPEIVGYCTEHHGTLARKNKSRRRGLPAERPEGPYVEVWTDPPPPQAPPEREPWTGTGGTCPHRRRYFCPTSEVAGCLECTPDPECCDRPDLHQVDLSSQSVTLDGDHPKWPLLVREVVTCNLVGCMTPVVVYSNPHEAYRVGYCRTKHKERARDARRNVDTMSRQAERNRLARVARTEARLTEKERRAEARRERERAWTAATAEREIAHAEALAEAERRRAFACPRPDKAAWKTPEGAAQEVRAMREKRHPDGPWLHPYLCDRGGPTGKGCGSYHVGNRLHHPTDDVVARWGTGVLS